MFVSFCPLDLQDQSFFVYPIEAGDNFEGTIALKAPIYGVAAHEFMVCWCIVLCSIFCSHLSLIY
jgi:hypothetical protein